MANHDFYALSEPPDTDFDPYTLDDGTITLEDWRRHSLADDEGCEVVRLHQHHDALLVA
ncbi:MAG TPA: hypothetical protein VFV00_15820 [Acidimicrobiales bacterium]|nr:hypothetical protein [Acidimicrobiales bacterium]